MNDEFRKQAREFRALERHADKQNVSEFAKWHRDLIGFDIFLNGIKVLKWEAFNENDLTLQKRHDNIPIQHRQF